MIPEPESVRKARRKGRRLMFIFLPLALLIGKASLSVHLNDPEFSSGFWGIAITALMAWPAVKGYRLQRTAKRFPSYYTALKQTGDMRLESIAAQLGASAETVRRELSRMTKLGFFPALSIDQSGDIALLDLSPPVHSAQEIQQPRVRVVCPACGAPGSVEKGGHGHCAYCHGTLSAD